MPSSSLLIVQCCCFSVTLTLALILLFSRLHQRFVSKSYEVSRVLLIFAFLLYAVHYLLQMIFGFRAQGEDVGALVNIVFYLPIALLLALATLRLSTSTQYQRRFLRIGIVGVVVNTSIFIQGLIRNQGVHMPWELRIMEVIYVAMIAFFIFNPANELRRTYHRIEDETADSNAEYNLYMRSSTVLLYAMGLVGSLSIFSTQIVLTIAAFFLLAIIYYVVCFVSLGVSMQSISSIIDEGSDSNSDTPEASEASAEASTPTTTPAAHLTPEQVAQISEAIAQWRAKQGYSASNLTSITMAQRLGIPKRLLTQYLTEKEGNTFRVWLSNIRIEEAKRMLTDTNYSIEAICESCGFSSRSWMTEKFKASTGMAPGDWRESQKKG